MIPEPKNTVWEDDIFDYGCKMAISINVTMGGFTMRYAAAAPVNRNDSLDCERRRIKAICQEPLKRRFWRYMGAA